MARLKKRNNISLSIDGVLVDIFYHDDDSFINEYAYKKYLLNVNEPELEPRWNIAIFITMWKTYKKYFDEANSVLRKLKIESLYDTKSTTV
jgi:hypothetical protein